MTDKANVRNLSLTAITEVLEEGKQSHIVVRKILKDAPEITSLDKAFFLRLTEGVIERVITLDYVINSYSSTPVKKMKKPVRNIIRMGTYQIIYMHGVPDSAACNESVKLSAKRGFAGLKGFVNGVLRSISRNKEEILKKISAEDFSEISDDKYIKSRIDFLSVKYSMPKWLVEKFTEELGRDKAIQMMEWFLEDRKISARLNTNKMAKEDIYSILKNEGVDYEENPYMDNAIYISNFGDIAKEQAFNLGLLTIQDTASMLPALIANPKQGSKVLDLCAAPGGKSLHVATLMKDTGEVVARDLTENKVAMIKENVKRCGLKNIKVQQFDATSLSSKDIETADIVIADLPCSGLGVIGNKPDIKYRVTKEDLTEITKLQKQILINATKYLKKDGVLIYSTCTVNSTENEDMVFWITKELGLKLQNIEPYINKKLYTETTKNGYLQVIPGVFDMDGFFIARFVKA